MYDEYRKLKFEFVGQTWLALGNPDGRHGVLLASSDLRRQIFVEAEKDMNEFIAKARVALCDLLYALDDSYYFFPHPNALVALG